MSTNVQVAQVGSSLVRRLIIWCFKFYGLWHDADASPLYRCYGYALHLIFTLMFTASMCARLMLLTDTEEILSASGMTFTLIALCVKNMNFLHFLPNIQIILENSLRFRLQSADEVALVAKRLGLFSIIAYCYTTSIHSAGFTQYVSGWWTRRMPFAAWFPYVNDEDNFLLIFVYQVLGMIMLSEVNIVMELLPCYMMFLLSIQLEVLGMRLSKFAQGESYFEPYGGQTDSEHQVELVKSFKECIALHQKLCRDIAAFEDCFTFAFFSQICFSGFIICNFALLMIFKSPSEDFFAYGYVIFVLCSMIAQVFLPCRFGYEVIYRSDQLSSAMYNSGWYNTDHQFRRVMIVFMERVKRCNVVTVGKLFPLSLETFTSIIYFAYRVYAVLSE